MILLNNIAKIKVIKLWEKNTCIYNFIFVNFDYENK
jgi:transglutaminase/protease-like cytokinesis protein 3